MALAVGDEERFGGAREVGVRVLLAAGLDARAWRLPLSGDGCTIFELDVPEALAKPLSAESTAASPQPKVRLETLSERALTVGAVVLLFGFTVPYASFKLRRDLYDDDFVRSPDALSLTS